MFDVSELEAARTSARLHLEALKRVEQERADTARSLHETQEKLEASRAHVRALKSVITELKADLQCAEGENRALRGQR